MSWSKGNDRRCSSSGSKKVGSGRRSLPSPSPGRSSASAVVLMSLWQLGHVASTTPGGVSNWAEQNGHLVVIDMRNASFRGPPASADEVGDSLPERSWVVGRAAGPDMSQSHARPKQDGR